MGMDAIIQQLETERRFAAVCGIERRTLRKMRDLGVIHPDAMVGRGRVAYLATPARIEQIRTAAAEYLQRNNRKTYA